MSPLSRTFVLAALLSACGTVQARPPNLDHAYSFNSGYEDQIKGGFYSAAYEAAIPLGGSLDGAGNYVFSAGSGLALNAEVVQRGTYSIEMRFAPTDVTGYRRLVDFKNKQEQSGLYIFDGAIAFLPNQVGANKTAFTANTFSDVVIKRYGATGTVKVYVDGVEQFSFADNKARNAVFALSFPAYFFQDDSSTPGEETGGKLDYLRVWKQSLSSRSVKALAKGQTPANVIES